MPRCFLGLSKLPAVQVLCSGRAVVSQVSLKDKNALAISSPVRFLACNLEGLPCGPFALVYHHPSRRPLPAIVEVGKNVPLQPFCTCFPLQNPTLCPHGVASIAQGHFLPSCKTALLCGEERCHNPDFHFLPPGCFQIAFRRLLPPFFAQGPRDSCS